MNLNSKEKKIIRKDIYKIPQKGLFCPIADKDKFITNASPNKYTSTENLQIKDNINNIKFNANNLFNNNDYENQRILSAKFSRNNNNNLYNNKNNLNKCHSGKVKI